MQAFSLRSAIAAACLFTSAIPGLALAGIVQQDGNPVKAIPLATYGMQVPAGKALQSILPSGWTAVVAPDAMLNTEVSWAPTETWLDVLSRVADRSSAGFLVDWNAHKLVVKSVPATVQDGVARTQIHQDASTPLPQLAPATRPQPMTTVPVAVSSPVTPSQASPQSVTASSPPPQTRPAAVAPHPTTAVGAGPARSFSNTSLRVVVDAIAEAYGLNVEMTAANIQLPGPVTLQLAGSLAEDIRLLERALGAVAPLEVTYYKASHELLVAGSTEASYVAFDARPVVVPNRSFLARVFGKTPPPPAAVNSPPPADAPVAGAGIMNNPPDAAPAARVPQSPDAVLATSPVFAARGNTPGRGATGAPTSAEPSMAATPSRTPVASGPATTPSLSVATAGAGKLIFDVLPGGRLSDAISAFMKTQGWEVSWQSQTDLEASGAIHVEAQSVPGVLKQILPRMGLVADLYKANHIAVIRPQSAETPPEGAK